MQLNLTSWLKLARPRANCLLISASEECTPLVHNLVRLCQTKLSEHSHRLNFTGDKYFKLNQISEVVQASSLFADKNFIELNFKTKPSSAQQSELSQLLTQLNDENFLVITCDKLDNKELAAAWLSEFAEFGDVLTLTGDYLECKVWAVHLCQQLALNLEEATCEFLLSMNQNNLAQLYQEIHKLALLFNRTQPITLAEAQASLLDNAQYNVFALAAAYLTGNAPLARKIFMNVCQSSEDAILLLWNLAEDLRKLIRIKGSLRSGSSFNSAISGLRIWGASVAAFDSAQRRLSYQQLLSYFDQLAEIDLQLKGVAKGYPLLALEQLIMRICNAN